MDRKCIAAVAVSVAVAVGACRIVIVTGGSVIAGAIIAMDAAHIGALLSSYPLKDLCRLNVTSSQKKVFLNEKAEAVIH